MVSNPITSWQIDGEEVETVTDFLFLGSKIIADSNYNHEIKRHLLLGKIAIRNLDSVLKSRDITFPTKIHIIKAMVFPVVTYRCEKRRLSTEELMLEFWCWRRLLRTPWTARRSNQSILREINLEYSLEGLVLKLKLQYFGYLMQKASSLEKTMMLGKMERRKKRGQRRIRWLDGITDSMNINLIKPWEMLKDREAWCTAVHGVGHDFATEQQQ